MKKAFTLIEIIIVVAIMTIFIGAGFSTYIKQIQIKELDRQVDAFAINLQVAKNKSIGRDLSPNTACATFDRYELVVSQTANPPQYNIRFVCNPIAGNRDLPVNVVKNMTMSGLSGSPYSIPFYYPYGCTNNTCTGATITVRIRNPANSSCKNVTIDSLGNITIGNVFACAT